MDTALAKGLAHPLRGQLVAALRHSARGTATSLAAQLHVSTGATSYHLRQLARHGLVAEVSRPGRERWWQLTDASPEGSAPGTVEARLRLSAGQAAQLSAELAELVDRYRLLSHSDEGDPILVRYAVLPASALAGDDQPPMTNRR